MLKYCLITFCFIDICLITEIKSTLSAVLTFRGFKLENNYSTNTQVENTRNILQLMFSPIFWTGVFFSGTTIIPLAMYLLDKFHDSSLKEVKTQYEISQAKLYSSIIAEKEELKRQAWDYEKLKEKHFNLASSNSALQEKYREALDLQYN